MSSVISQIKNKPTNIERNNFCALPCEFNERCLGSPNLDSSEGQTTTTATTATQNNNTTLQTGRHAVCSIACVRASCFSRACVLVDFVYDSLYFSAHPHIASSQGAARTIRHTLLYLTLSLSPSTTTTTTNRNSFNLRTNFARPRLINSPAKPCWRKTVTPWTMEISTWSRRRNGNARDFSIRPGRSSRKR